MPRPCQCNRVPECHLCTIWVRHPNSPAARAWRGETVAQIAAAPSAAASATHSPPRQNTAATKRRIEALKAPTPCARRGAPTGEVDECVTCTGRVPVPLLACSLHGECFTGNYTLTGVRACARCGDCVTVVVPGLLDPLPGPWRTPGRWCNDPAEVDRHAAAARAIAAGPVADPPDMDDGAAVVTCGGGKYWPGVVVMVRMLREAGCALPVEVWYRGSCEEVKPADVQGMGVELIDADELAAARGDNRVPRGRPTLGGWEAKLYALAHTRRRYVAFIDADAYFVSDPGRLLDLARVHGFAAWQEGENVRWPRCGFPGGKPPGAPVGIQGGQFAVDRRAAWRELVLAHWVCQHSDYYWPNGRPAATWPLFGDQDAWRLAFTLTGFRPHVIGPSEYRAGWGYVCWLDGVVAVEHRCFSKLTPAGTAGEARALAHYARVLGADGPTGWLTPDEAALLRGTCRGRRALEWGRFLGRSTAVIAGAAAACWSVDRLPAAPAAAELARLGLADVARLVEGDYTDPATLPPWAPEVVFVDGEHHARAVRRDLANAAALLAPGGVIALHDHGDPNAPDVAPAADAWAAGAGWVVRAKAGTLAVLARP